MFPWLHAIRHGKQKVWKGYLIYSYLRLPAFFSSFPRDLIPGFTVCLSVKLCPFPRAWLPPLGSPANPHLSEGHGRSATAPPTHTIFPAIQHFYLAWLFFSPLLVLCIYHLFFSRLLCVNTDYIKQDY